MIIDLRKVWNFITSAFLPVGFVFFLFLMWSFVSTSAKYYHAAFQVAVEQAEALETIAEGFGQAKGNST